MKKLFYFLSVGFLALAILVLSVSIANAADCSDTKSQNEIQEEQVITTDVPGHLKNAVIIIRTADGRESQVSANQFKVVPRKQQRVVTKVKEHTERICKVSGKEKNLVIVGGRRDFTDMDVRVNGKTATVDAEKGLVLDAGYMRQNIFDTNLGVGASVDTNGTLRGMIGVEF